MGSRAPGLPRDGERGQRGRPAQGHLRQLRGTAGEPRRWQQLDGDNSRPPFSGWQAGIRRVYLDAKTAELLRAHHETQDLERQFTGEAWEDNDLVFSQPDGRPWNPDHVSKRLKKLAAKAGVRVITLHEAGRHTGNSLMRDAWVDQELRMRIVGHADKGINDRYTHTLEEAHRAAAEQTAALVDEVGGTS